MNSRPEPFLSQAENDLAMAQLARSRGYLAQECVVGMCGRPTEYHTSLEAWPLDP